MALVNSHRQVSTRLEREGREPSVQVAPTPVAVDVCGGLRLATPSVVDPPALEASRLHLKLVFSVLLLLALAVLPVCPSCWARSVKAFPTLQSSSARRCREDPF